MDAGIDAGRASFTCPQCGSESTQRLSVVHASGTSTTTSTSTHVGAAFSGSRLVPAAATSTTSGVQQSTLANKAAPPSKKDEFGKGAMIASLIAAPIVSWILAGIVGAVVNSSSGGDTGYACAGCVFFVLPVVLIVAIVVKYRDCRPSKAWNQDVYPQLLAKWERQMLCHRCGAIFDTMGAVESKG